MSPSTERLPPRELFFSERIWSCHAGGYWWMVEGVSLPTFTGPDGFNESALGQAPFKWIARLKIRRCKKAMAEQAREESSDAS